MRMNQKNSITVVSGAIGFLASVIFLHAVQMPAGYSPVEQLMSELALGEKGNMMFFAFLSLAFATIGTLNIVSYQTNWLIKIILVIAAMAFVGAGYFTLATAMEVHITLVAIAFIALVLGMYLIPRSIAAFQTTQAKLTCWGLATATAVSVALGQSVLPIGIAQRMATACLLCWFIWLAVFNLKHRI